MDAGRFDRRATVMRRPVLLDEAGADTGERGDYAAALTLSASYRPLSVQEAAQGGRAQNVETGALTLRDSAQARTVTNADRIALAGRDFAIVGVGLPDRRNGTITLSIATDLGGE